MNETSHHPKPQGPSLTAKPINLPAEAQPAALKDQSEEVPESVAAHDAKRLEQINQSLTFMRQQDCAMLRELIEDRSKAIKIIIAALKRGDLTLRQTRLVLALAEKGIRQQKQSLHAEKRQLEQKRDSGTRA